MQFGAAGTCLEPGLVRKTPENSGEGQRERTGVPARTQRRCLVEARMWSWGLCGRVRRAPVAAGGSGARASGARASGTRAQARGGARRPGSPPYFLAIASSPWLKDPQMPSRFFSGMPCNTHHARS